MSNSSSPAVTPGLAPMYGAPQTPTPVPVPQAVQEECIVTSSYGSSEQQGTRGYDSPVSQVGHGSSSSGPSQQSSSQGGYNQPQQQQHYGSSQQQQQHYNQQQQQQPLYHHQQPQYHQPGPVVQVQFTQQHPQPQPQQQHYQQVVHQLHPPSQHHHSSSQQHYQHHQMNNLQPSSGSNRTPNPSQQQQYIQQQQTSSQQQQTQPPTQQQSTESTPTTSNSGESQQQQPPQQPQPQQVGGSQHPPEQSGSPRPPAARGQFYQMAPGGSGGPQQRFVTVRQSPGGPTQQVVQVVRPAQGGQGGPGGPPTAGQRFHLVQQPQGGAGSPVRQVVIRQGQGQQPQPAGHQFQQANVIRPQSMRPGTPVRYVVPVQLRPGGVGPVPPHVRMPVNMVRPGAQGPRPSMGGPQAPGGSPRQGVIQHTVAQQQGSPSRPQQYQRGYSPAPGMGVQQGPGQQGAWRGPGPGPGGPPVQRMVRPPGSQMPGQGGPMMRGQQFVGQQSQQGGPQGMGGGPEKIAYNVEHVFVENGVQVRKMPVEINGETIWVECVPGGGQSAGPVPAGPQGLQNQPGIGDHEGGIMMDLGDSDGSDMPSQPKPRSTGGASSYTADQRAGIMREVVEEHISPSDLAKKYSISAHAIRDWVKKAGHQLPKSYKRSKTSQQSNQGPPGTFGRVPDLPTTPLPQGQVVGVATGDPPSIESPPGGSTPALNESGQSASPAGSTGPQGVPSTPGKRIPGKLAMCKGCGFAGEDLSMCLRCRRKLPEDVKLIDDASYKPKPDSTEQQGGMNKNKALRMARIPQKGHRRKGGNPDEPVPECIALSSDEEGDDDDNSRSSVVDSENGTSRDQSVEPNVVLDENIVDGSQTGQFCTLSCRSIRVGNYKVLPKEKIIITEKGVQIKVPAILNPNEVVTINITMTDVLKVLAHFGKSMPLLFLYIGPEACKKVRQCLKMTNRQSFFLDVQSNDETQKRITILPEKLTEENKTILKTHFGANVQELESKDANEILVRSSPTSLKSKMGLGGPNMGNMMGQGGNNRPMGSGGPGSVEPSVTKYCQYPPDGAGMVSVTNEDYNCLEAEQFLNDVIIDFYLKYLQHGTFRNIDQMLNRTHIFTTYFYKRLTTRPNNGKVKAHPVEDNPNLSAAEKRYERVKKWTKKVNLFDKDFIIVPINEHAHWFVCVICFPGQTGSVRSDDGTPCETPVQRERVRKPKRRNVKKGPLTIGSTTIIPLKGGNGPGADIRYTLEDDGSDRDEAEASDDDMEDEEDSTLGSENKRLEGGDSSQDTPGGDEEPRPSVRRPCILIFDSLKGSSKARTCQTLRDYLTCEWNAKMVPEGSEERTFNTAIMPGCGPTVQQQPNFSDCGIYLLQYVESFFRDPIVDYNVPIKGIKQWFSKEEVESKRGNIADLIRKLAAEQNPGKEFLYPDLNFTNPPEEGEGDDDSEEEDDEEYEAEVMHQSRQPIMTSGASLVRLSSGIQGIPQGLANRAHLMVGPAKHSPGPLGSSGSQGKVLIQKTGNQLKMTSLASIPVVPPGVTVTPAPGRLLNSNISIRKMSSGTVVSSSSNSGAASNGLSREREIVQTSPDSTSHEESMGREGEELTGMGDLREGGNTPDSQGFESVSNKRGVETEDMEGESKRIKSDSSESSN